VPAAWARGPVSKPTSSSRPRGAERRRAQRCDGWLRASAGGGLTWLSTCALPRALRVQRDSRRPPSRAWLSAGHAGHPAGSGRGAGLQNVEVLLNRCKGQAEIEHRARWLENLPRRGTAARVSRAPSVGGQLARRAGPVQGWERDKGGRSRTVAVGVSQEERHDEGGLVEEAEDEEDLHEWRRDEVSPWPRGRTQLGNHKLWQSTLLWREDLLVVVVDLEQPVLRVRQLLVALAPREKLHAAGSVTLAPGSMGARGSHSQRFTERCTECMGWRARTWLYT
jgi:hypothetical protein